MSAAFTRKVTNGTFTVDFAFQGPTPAGLLPGQALQGNWRSAPIGRRRFFRPAHFLKRTGGRLDFRAGEGW